MKSPESCDSIEDIREAIDKIDSEVIQLLGRRFQYVKQIIKFKEPTEESIIAKSRFDSVIKSRRNMAQENGLDQNLVERIYRELLNFFIAEEMKLINKE